MTNPGIRSSGFHEHSRVTRYTGVTDIFTLGGGHYEDQFTSAISSTPMSPS
jgi:hypothetical protein